MLFDVAFSFMEAYVSMSAAI